METSAGFWLLVVLLLNSAGTQTVKLYFKAGGTLVLRPVPVPERITDILWQYDRNLLAEWVEGMIELTYYSRFRGRSRLNTDTGVLEIRDMTSADTLVYSVDINNKVQSQVYQAVEIKDVPEPDLYVQPLACNPTSESCRLNCYGDTKDAGPVSYFWKKGNGEWEQLENKMEIFNNEETRRVNTFFCKMKNPLSERNSKPIKNPFYRA